MVQFEKSMDFRRRGTLEFLGKTTAAAVAITIAVSLRRATDAAPKQPTIARYLVGMLLAAGVVAALTVPAIAATEAGGSSVPDDLFLPSHLH